MATIETMIKDASKGLATRIKRQVPAQTELVAARKMDERAVIRLNTAETVAAKLDAEVLEAAGVVARLTDRPIGVVLNEVRAQVSAENENIDLEPLELDENGFPVFPGGNDDAPADVQDELFPEPANESPAVGPKPKSAKGKGPVAPETV